MLLGVRAPASCWWYVVGKISRAAVGQLDRLTARYWVQISQACGGRHGPRWPEPLSRPQVRKRKVVAHTSSLYSSYYPTRIYQMVPGTCSKLWTTPRHHITSSIVHLASSILPRKTASQFFASAALVAAERDGLNSQPPPPIDNYTHRVDRVRSALHGLILPSSWYSSKHICQITSISGSNMVS